VNPPASRARLAALDTAQPCFAPYALALEELRYAMAEGADVAAALSRRSPQPPAAMPRFVPSAVMPPEEAYEAFVARTGTVPTRDNLHDLFNGLVWARFPQAKRRLNELQAHQIARQEKGGSRGPVRDAITLFDENGALLQAPPALWDALLARDWRRLFVELRPLWAQARVLVFGHALLEKLVEPHKEITAHVWRFQCPAQTMAEVDAWLAGQFTAATLAGKPFTPLPVLGIPGWCPENQNFSFYDDSLVFRPPARKT
jgi:hypothetical protein